MEKPPFQIGQQVTLRKIKGARSGQKGIIMKAPQRRMVTNRKRKLENDENKPLIGQKDPVADNIKAIQKRDIPIILSITSGPEKEECKLEHLSTVNDS